jgi:hypothetical protein
MRSLLLAAMTLVAANTAFADPKTDFLLYCRGCHLANGTGVAPDVPSLHDELGRLVAIPGGREYIVRVPGVSQNAMTNEKLAAVLNWVLAEFNANTTPANFKPYTGKEVERWRDKVLIDPLKYRASVLGKPMGSEPVTNP